MLDLKDKLNLLWKFLFLAVFTYGVFSLACCSSKSDCGSQKSCPKTCQIDESSKPPCQQSK